MRAQFQIGARIEYVRGHRGGTVIGYPTPGWITIKWADGFVSELPPGYERIIRQIRKKGGAR